MTRIDRWFSLAGSNVSFKGTVGMDDPLPGSSLPHPDHAAVWDALLASNHDDVRGYYVSHHLTGAGSPTWERTLAEDVCDRKRAALDEFKVWRPGEGRYAIGYHSVPGLFDSVSSSCQEFVLRAGD